MTRIFVFTNHKGGVGKSTSATNTALGITGMLRRAGSPNSRVLLIHTDSQGHATLVTTGRDDFGADNSLYTVLSADRATAAQTLLKQAEGNITRGEYREARDHALQARVKAIEARQAATRASGQTP